ncbi:MAG TPA: response regulator, partial [Methylovirgula sp.]
DILNDAGFFTREAACAEEALDSLHEPAFADEIAALVTDVDMPGDLDGVGLAALVQECWPRMGVVVTSGAHRGAALLLRKPAVFLPKPFRADRLIAALRSVIAPQFALAEQRFAS